MIEKDLLKAKEIEKRLNEKILCEIEKESQRVSEYLMLRLAGKLIITLSISLAKSYEKKDIFIELENIITTLKMFVDRDIDSFIDSIEDEHKMVELII